MWHSYRSWCSHRLTGHTVCISLGGILHFQSSNDHTIIRWNFYTQTSSLLNLSWYYTIISCPFTFTVPTGFKFATKHPHWLMEIEDEIPTLMANETWDLVHHPTNLNLFGSKWIFHTKIHSNGPIEWYKAWLVVEGFTQVPGLNYSHTFIPVIKESTICIVFISCCQANMAVASTRCQKCLP